MNRRQLAAHLQTDRYDSFALTDAIRPGPAVPVVPRAGYRREVFRDRKAGSRLPMLMAAASREHLFDLFLDLLAPLGTEVDVVLETSHGRDADKHRELRRGGVDLPVLMSHFCDFEELLLNDGCTGVAVLAHGRPMEVQFDEHKLLVVYAPKLAPFRRILHHHGLERDDGMKFLCEAEHLHSTSPTHSESFRELCYRLGAIGAEKVLNEEC